MNSVIHKLGFLTLLLLFSSALSFAAAKEFQPVCIPGDMQCLHPIKPMEVKDVVVVVYPGNVDATSVDYDEHYFRDRPYYSDDNGRERAYREGERDGERHEARERHERHEEREHQERHHPDIHINLGR